MNTDERFERIEATLLALAEAQVRTQTAVAGLTEGLGGLVQTVNGLAQAVNSFASSTDARMKRIEENLDALIRAITAEHSNGRQK